jgi:hypothetical protein
MQCGKAFIHSHSLKYMKELTLEGNPMHFQIAAVRDHGLAHLLFWPNHHAVTMGGQIGLCPQPHVHMGKRDQRGNFSSLSKHFFISYKCTHV